jgi:hypothetical protein
VLNGLDVPPLIQLFGVNPSVETKTIDTLAEVFGQRDGDFRSNRTVPKAQLVTRGLAFPLVSFSFGLCEYGAEFGL